MTTWYNEFDPRTAAWLRQLIKDGLVEPGDVDERDMREIDPAELEGRSRLHYFAGIGGWPLALDLAGFPRDRAVTTASCPCQPFSSAGKRLGFADERHLWPVLFRHVQERLPQLLIGEQVSGSRGRAWLDHVFNDLESAGYTCGAVDLPACSVGAFHIRQRMYWMAYRDLWGYPRPEEGTRSGQHALRSSGGAVERVGDCDNQGREGRGLLGPTGERGRGSERPTGPSSLDGHWADIYWLRCRDGKTRPIPAKSSLFPLAPRLPGDLALIRGAGNAIVPPLAATFVRAVMQELGIEGVTP